MQPPQVRTLNGGAFKGTGTYQYPMSSSNVDGFAVRNLGTMVAQGANNPVMPSWRASPADRDPGLVGPRGWDGTVGRYYGSDSVEPNTKQWFGSEEGGRLNPANMIDEIQLPPGVITQTPGMMTNERVHYQVSLNKDWLFGISQILSVQMPMFIRTTTTNPVVIRQGLPFRSGNWEGFSTVVNLPTLNYALACEAYADAADKTPRDVCKEWAFGGVIVNVTGLSTSVQPMNASVVYSVRGPERVFDIWGPSKEAGTPLFFIIKMVEVPPHYILDPAGQNLVTPSGNGRPLRPRAMQVVPYANNAQPIPPRHVLSYFDSDNNFCYGTTISIGRVSHRTVDGSRIDADGLPAMLSSFLSTHAMINQPNFEILIDPPVITHFS